METTIIIKILSALNFYIKYLICSFNFILKMQNKLHSKSNFREKEIFRQCLQIKINSQRKVDTLSD